MSASTTSTPPQRRLRAREKLAEIRRRFVRAELSAGGRLRVEYLDSVSGDRAIGYALLWCGASPRRELCIRVRESLGVVHWELVSPDLGRSRTGGPGFDEFRSEQLGRLIEALLDQDSWGRGKVPNIPGAASSELEQHFRGKVLEVRERLHEAVEAVPRNVAHGFKSAVKERSRLGEKRRPPPSGWPPAVVRARKRD